MKSRLPFVFAWLVAAGLTAPLAAQDSPLIPSVLPTEPAVPSPVGPIIQAGAQDVPPPIELTPLPMAMPKVPSTSPPTTPLPSTKLPAPMADTPAELSQGTIIDSETYKPLHEHRHKLFDSIHHSDEYGLKSLFDSVNPQDRKGKHWYEKLNLRGYTQFRYGRTIGQDPNGAEPLLFGDRNINGEAENFWIRRARFILFGDVSDYLYLYAQPDFAITPPGTVNQTFFSQLRDLYADVYLTKDKEHRLRVGLSKVPYGWENMQSSQNRFPLDRTVAFNSAVSPNERDLGVFYYWTPEEKQKLFRELVDGGLRGSGNYGVFALGIYNGQGGSQLEQNLNVHTVARATWPWQMENGQVVEVSVQGYTGEYTVEGAPIRPFGVGAETTPKGTRASGDRTGLTDRRLGGTFVYYPQPFGFQTEWNFGEGPGLNDDQNRVEVRPLMGGYAMMMYKHDTEEYGTVTPYARYQYYDGGIRSIANAPYGITRGWDLGIEWWIRREMRLTVEYSIVDGIDLVALNKFGSVPYEQFEGGLIRAQFQINY